jgi:hypothetical protein
MSKQEPSYFEADQPMDQAQDQLQVSPQEDPEISPPEISANVAQKELQPEAQEPNLMAEAVAEDNGQFRYPVSRRLPVYGASSWRFPRRRQRELRYILMTVLAVAVLTAGVFIAGMGYLGMRRPIETYFFSGKVHQKVIINNEQGSITVHGQSQGPFGFHVERYSQGFGPGLLGMDVVYTQYGATTTLTAHVPPDILFSGIRGINIDVTVPTADAIQVHTGEGSIALQGLTGDVEASTDKGSLAVENCQGRASLDAMSGSVSVSQFSGQLTMSSHQGNIKANDVHLSGQSSALAESGAIILNGSLERHGKYHLSTDTGPINLFLPETAAFHLAFSNNFGFFLNEFGSQVHGSPQQAVIAVSTEYGTFSLHKVSTK